MKKKIFIMLIALILIVLAVGCSSNDGQASKASNQNRNYQRTNNEGEISMSFMFTNPLGQGKDGYLTFMAALDNHSYNLDQYDLSEYATLVDDKGNTPKGEPQWAVNSGGGHHVVSYLLFPDEDFITSDTKYIKLIIKDFIDTPEREFVWEKEFLGVKE